ncbi:unnamed protein product [Cochlearia groenlandica]
MRKEDVSKGDKAKKNTNFSQILNKKINGDKKHDLDRLSEKLSAMEAYLLCLLPVLQERLRLLCPHGQVSTDMSSSSSSLTVDVQTGNKPTKTNQPAKSNRT